VLSDWERWLFDPAKIAAEFVALIPEVFHEDYLLAQGLAPQSTPEAFSEPMAMASSIPPPPPGGGTNTTGGASTSNTTATLIFPVDAGFGSSFGQIFQKTNLVAGAQDWSVLAENVVVTAGTERVWTDVTSSNIVSRFYILNDPSKDLDGDFLNDGMEVFVVRSDPSVADSDGGQIPDGYEHAFGMDVNDSSDDTAAIAAYQLVAGDVDADGRSQWLEGVSGTNPHDRFD